MHVFFDTLIKMSHITYWTPLKDEAFPFLHILHYKIFWTCEWLFLFFMEQHIQNYLVAIQEILQLTHMYTFTHLH